MGKRSFENSKPLILRDLLGLNVSHSSLIRVRLQGGQSQLVTSLLTVKYIYN
jgi:hypothetical protein